LKLRNQDKEVIHMSYAKPARGARWIIQALILSLLPAFSWAGPVDINKADAATLARELNGIGMSRAQAIVAYREKNGAFKSAEDLLKIKGIGAKVVETNRANIRLERAPAGGAKQPE
jgi:competence protein ComEA